MRLKLCSTVACLLGAACSDPVSHPEGILQLNVERPKPEYNTAVITPYMGSDAYVLEAQAKHRTPLDLHRNVITRTCGPTNGVCHNQKEYPDLHTPSNLLDAVNASCNVQPGEWSQVFDGCERPGDLFKLTDGATKAEVAYIDYIPGDDEDYGENHKPSKTSPGLHVYLAESIGGTRGETWGNGIFFRKAIDNGAVDELMRTRYETHWWILDGGKHLFGEVADYQVDAVNRVLDSRVEQGDMNRNGVLGAQAGLSLNLLKAGAPEESYLIGRLRSELRGSPIPGTRMPLANEPLSVADMLALFCFVEGLPKEINGEYDLTTPINYGACSYTTNPESLNLLGKGVTWISRVQPLLKANCGGCHGGMAPMAGFDVMSEGNYERLLNPATQGMGMPFVTPGDPSRSYLWLKLKAAPGTLGLGMPLDANNAFQMLPSGALIDIETWIKNGAKAQE